MEEIKTIEAVASPDGEAYAIRTSWGWLVSAATPKDLEALFERICSKRAKEGEEGE